MAISVAASIGSWGVSGLLLVSVVGAVLGLSAKCSNWHAAHDLCNRVQFLWCPPSSQIGKAPQAALNQPVCQLQPIKSPCGYQHAMLPCTGTRCDICHCRGLAPCAALSPAPSGQRQLLRERAQARLQRGQQRRQRRQGLQQRRMPRLHGTPQRDGCRMCQSLLANMHVPCCSEALHRRHCQALTHSSARP